MEGIDDKIVNMYRQGKFLYQIAQDTGCSEKIVRKKLREKGLNSKPRYIANRGYILSRGTHYYWSDAMIEKLRKEFPKNSREDLSIMFGIPASAVYRKAYALRLKKNTEWLKAYRAKSVRCYNIERRHYSEKTKV